jgi:hypothetical protein
MAVPSVTFEVERFEWTSDNRLEVAGRWFGLRGRRFIRPTLDIEVDGERRRMLALLEHKPWAADDGEHWIAAFAWNGNPVAAAAAELAVGPDLAVELPAPETPAGARKPGPAAASGSRKARAGATPGAKAAGDGAPTGMKEAGAAKGSTTAAPDAPDRVRKEAPSGRGAGAGRGARADRGAAREPAGAVERREARPPRDRALQAELTAARAEIKRLTEQLEHVAAAHSAEAGDLQRQLTAEQRAARRLATDLETAQEQIASVEAGGARQVQQLRRERDSAIAAREAARAESEQAARERDSAVRDRAVAEQARDAAVRDRAAAERARDGAMRERAAAQQERDAAARARDKARHERNAWLTRARATLTELEAAAAERDPGGAGAAGHDRRGAAAERDPGGAGAAGHDTRAAAAKRDPGGAGAAKDDSGRAAAAERDFGEAVPAPQPDPRRLQPAGGRPQQAAVEPPVPERDPAPAAQAADPPEPIAPQQPAAGVRQTPGRALGGRSRRRPHPADPPPPGATRQLHTPLVQWRPGARRSMIPIPAPGVLALVALVLLVAIVIALVLWAI